MKKRISLIGLGHLGNIHLKLLTENINWEIAGVFDIDDSLMHNLAKEYGLTAFQSVKEAISNADVVDIITPSTTHFEIARDAIISGKHVFIEKPSTSTLEDSKTLKKLAEEANVKVQIGHVERFNPAFIAALPYLKEPKFIEVHRIANYNLRGTDVSVVKDLALHDLDLILNIVKSNVKKLSVSGTKLVSESADLLNCRLEFENGCVANVTSNRIGFKNSRQFRVYTPNNFVSINLLDKKVDVIKVQNFRENSKNLTIPTPPLSQKKEIAFSHPIILPTNAINDELNAFHSCIINNTMPLVSINDAINVLELIDTIEEAII
jgi:predicted dehydrogenase